jgi:hypothetical protein
MNKFQFQDREVTFSIIRGEIINHQRMSTPELNSNGHNIQLTNNITQEIWLLKEDGREDSFRLVNKEIPIRPGQLISLIYITTTIKNKDNTIGPILINHNAKKYWTLPSKNQMRVDYPRYKFGITGWAFIAASIGTFLATNWWAVPVAVIGYYMVTGTKYNKTQNISMQKLFDDHLESIIHNEFSTVSKLALNLEKIKSPQGLH